MKKVLEVAKHLAAWGSVQLDMVRAILPKFQFPSHSHKGEYLRCIEIFQHFLGAGFEGSENTQKLESCTKRTIKEMSEKPKSKCSRNFTNSGPAKASNGYAVRGLGVAVNRYGVHNSTRSTLKMSLWSSPALPSFRGYSTGTGCSTNVLDKLNNLHERSKNFPDQPIDRDLYKTFILNKDMFLIAYNRLKSRPGMMTPGVSPWTLDGFSSEIIDKTILKLRSEAFSFSPALGPTRPLLPFAPAKAGGRRGGRRRIEIPKASGGSRPLTIGDPQPLPLQRQGEKVVQEIIRLVLEAIYEPMFKASSFGFRPKRGCHTALRYVFTKLKGCAWWIEGDIKGCFDYIPHDKLMAILSQRILDQRFLQLIRKALNAGYLQGKSPIYDIVGTPQGSIISPILANIYLHQLDQYVESLKSDFDIFGPRRRHPIVRKLQWAITKAKRTGDSDAVRRLAVEMRNSPNKLVNSDNRHIQYVRYADDWILAVNGSYTEATNILNKVTVFLKDLGLTVSSTKTKITNTYKEPALFLGTNIAHSKAVTYSLHRKGTFQRNSGFLVLRAPMERIQNKLREAGYMNNHKGVSRISWLSLEVRQIINLANSIIRGYENYYSFAHNKGQLCTYVFYIIRDVVLRTLANKLSLKTRAAVIKKFGPGLALFDQNIRDKNNKPILITKLHKPSYRTNIWDFKSSVNTNIKGLYASSLSLATLDNLSCSVCGSDHKVEMHHIRAMKDIKHKKGTLDYLMAGRRRKQIPVCRDCHMKYHSGQL
uniref:Reverse transcriptase domain-containing protein n=1 Tax=Termitomyces sp. TaxID=1916073 RepID=A0A386TYV4_9AGAR|nr:hypothetical protein C0993_000042 [Termitomyces sp.]